MTDIIPVKTPGKRRRHSVEFKARILAACEQPGASVASIALANGLNANLIHKWRRTAKTNQATGSTQAGFLPLALTPHPGSIASDVSVIIEVNDIKIHWPVSHIDQALSWLRALQS